jgi:catechol 2,3-dioxygenase-like lactoylglutathione lyase family enzyme
VQAPSLQHELGTFTGSGGPAPSSHQICAHNLDVTALCVVPSLADMNDSPLEFFGLHHIRLPVSDVMRSRDWYIDVLGFEPRLVLEDEDHVVGVVVGHDSGVILGLHYEPERARALRGFCPVALNVGTIDDLHRWCARLETLGISHSAPTDGHLGRYVEVADPDGLIILLHTAGQPSADEA